MKKKIMITLSILLCLVVLFVGINLVDAPRAKFSVGIEIDDSSPDSFVKSIMKAPSFERANAFYRLWSLTEPPNVDIEADEIFMKYRRMHDPQFDNKKYIDEWKKGKENSFSGTMFEGKNYKKFTEKRKALLDKYGTFDSHVSSGKLNDWVSEILTHKEAVRELKALSGIYFERYEKMVACDIIDEFTHLSKDSNEIIFPNFLAWLQQAKLYNAVYMLDSLEGNWENGVKKILLQFDFCKRSTKSNRFLLTTLISRAIMRESLYALANLMNSPNFPPKLYDTIIQGLPPLQYEELGTRISLLFEGYVLGHQNYGWFLFQENRTRQYFYDAISRLINTDKLPPYEWKGYPLDNLQVKTGLFWWLQNAKGKIAFDKMITKNEGHFFYNLYVSIFKAYFLKSVYDMTRISAELHKTYTQDGVTGKPVQEILNGLETYRTWLDPTTGKPYKWDNKKQLLYGFGLDMDDDGGRISHDSMDGDVPLPVILYVKK